jgi:hypothetical protein
MENVEEARLPLGKSLDSTAALVRGESDHLDTNLEALVDRLSAVPALDISVRRRHGRLRRLLGDLPYLNDLQRRTAPIDRLAVSAGSCAYWLESEPGRIRCWTESSGGASEELSFAAWATKLVGEIAQQNLVNHASLVALRHLVVHDQVD